MPSDSIHEALEKGREAFRSVLATTIEQARGALAAQRADETEEAAELGALGAQRIDVGRFTTLLAKRKTADATALERMEEAFQVLGEVAERATRPFEISVEPGRTLRDSVAAALAEVGRAFGASRVFELARTGHWREEEHAPWLKAFGFSHWNRDERGFAPPLVVNVEGRDLRVGGLADFLDGSVKLVLLVKGEAPPAPLVRLVTPNTYVIQSHDPAALAGFAVWQGPGVAAIVPESAARFVHDPAKGSELWERMSVEHVPSKPPPGTIGGLSAAQQRDEIAQLLACAKQPPAPAPAAATGGNGPVEASASAEPADKLAAWLLANAELGDLG